MNVDRALNTMGLLLLGTGFLVKVSDRVIQHIAEESFTSLVSTIAILVPTTVLIVAGTIKICDELGWQTGLARDFVIYFIAVNCSVALSSAAAVGFGITTTLRTGIVVAQIAFGSLCGVNFVKMGLENCILGDRHQF